MKNDDQTKTLKEKWEKILEKEGLGLGRVEYESKGQSNPQVFGSENEKTSKSNNGFFGGHHYYQLCNRILREYKFKRPAHKKVFELHAEGLSQYKIAKTVKRFNKSKGRIQRYTPQAISQIIKRIRDDYVYGKKQ